MRNKLLILVMFVAGPVAFLTPGQPVDLDTGSAVTKLAPAPTALARGQVAGPEAVRELTLGDDGFAGALSRHERILAVVEALNARAAHAWEAGEVGEDGVSAANQATEPAARVIYGAGVPDGSCFIDVALVHAAGVAANVADVVSKILPDPRIATVTAIDTTLATPTVAELKSFDAILFWSNVTPMQPDPLGDNIADYVDAGGGVVVMMFGLRASNPARTVNGRFLASNYYCIERSTGSSFAGPAKLGTVHQPTHPVMAGVTNFDGGPNVPRSPAALHAMATRIADWNTGEALAASRYDLAGRRVDLNFYPPSSDVYANGWISSTDGGLLMANALVDASGCDTLSWCSPVLFEQAPPDPTLDARNSNTPAAGVSTQQVADDFSLNTGGAIGAMTLWAMYYIPAGGAAPPVQDFVINIYDDVGGNPGTVVFTDSVSVVPVDTGLVHSGSGNPIYQYDITLNTVFTATPGTTYWLSPLGNTAGFQWAWQFYDSAANARRSRSSPTGSWTTWDSNLAFVLCGGAPPKPCPGDFDCDGDRDFDDIDPFVEALSTGKCKCANFANCDPNGDGKITFDDIDPFITLLGVPCP